MDCPKVEEGGKCGGPADAWKALYVMSKHCCEAELGWIAVAKCDAQSNLASFDGSSQWYVDWEKNKCVKDCNDKSEANCGGLAKGTWVQLHETMKECCGRLSWMDQKDCTA